MQLVFREAIEQLLQAQVALRVVEVFPIEPEPVVGDAAGKGRAP